MKNYTLSRILGHYSHNLPMTLTDLSTYSVFIPLAFGLYFFRYLAAPLKAVFVLIVVGCTVELLGLPIFERASNDLDIYTIYTLIEYLLVSLFYYLIIRGSIQKKVIIWGSIIYLLAALIIVNSTSSEEYFGRLVVIEALFVLCWILMYFRQVILYQTDSVLKTSSVFIISVGFLVVSFYE
ncbi:MAG: hypothetical protein KF734_01270 [Saprospiraceae bacterium]|nr:hypothetical protein [Saprospiraceae bacterium]